MQDSKQGDLFQHWISGDGFLLPPIAGGKSGGSTTTVNTVAPQTPEQKQLQDLQLSELQKQNIDFSSAAASQNPQGAFDYLDKYKAWKAENPATQGPLSGYYNASTGEKWTPAQYQNVLNTDSTNPRIQQFAPTYAPGPTNPYASSPYAGLENLDSPSFRDQLTQQYSTQQQQNQLQSTVLKNLNDRLSGNAPLLTDAQQKGLDQTYASAQSQGEQNLTRYVGEAANMRGLNISDSPIGGELARQGANLNLGLQSAKASSALDLSQAGNNFNAALAGFNANLQQQAFANRAALAGYQSPTLGGLSGQLQALQMSQGTSKSSYNVPGFQQTMGAVSSLAGGLGGLGLGVGAMMSDRRLKSDVVRIGTHPSGVGFYEYTLFGRRERGVMADEVRAVHPQAAVLGPHGYWMVNYALLGAV